MNKLPTGDRVFVQSIGMTISESTVLLSDVFFIGCAMILLFLSIMGFIAIWMTSMVIPRFLGAELLHPTIWNWIPLQGKSSTQRYRLGGDMLLPNIVHCYHLVGGAFEHVFFLMVPKNASRCKIFNHVPLLFQISGVCSAFLALPGLLGHEP